MKIKIAFCMAALFYFFINPAMAEIPRQVGGFVLGEKIDNFITKLRMETSRGIRYLECVKEVEIKKTEGFKSGMIYYGTCQCNNIIIKIKLKYEDSSAKFYEELLKRIKRKFGEPDEWKGDPFHVVIAWKWHFTDKDGNKISMILQHNTENADDKLGNVIKLKNSTLMEKEQKCFKKHKKHGHNMMQPLKKKKKINWDFILPK